jgi:hypothetical protein
MTQSVLEQKPRVRGSKDASRQVTLEEVKAMSDEELRAQVALLFGWTPYPWFTATYLAKTKEWYEPFWSHESGKFKCVPDYSHDLNAVHEVIMSLDCRNSLAYARILQSGQIQLGEGIGYQSSLRPFYEINATARQRCEALVLCLSARETNTSGSGVSHPKPAVAAARKEGQ